jgi:hypothetical protein
MSVAVVEGTVMAWEEIDKDPKRELVRRNSEKMDETHYKAAVRRLRGYAVMGVRRVFGDPGGALAKSGTELGQLLTNWLTAKVTVGR